MDYFRFRSGALFEIQHADCDGKFESARTAGAGIEIEHAFVAADAGLMRVSIEHGREFGGGWIEMQGVHIVEHVNIVALQKEHIGFWEKAAWAAAIHIAPDRRNRSDLFEGFENGWVADIAEMQDAFNAGEGGHDFRAQQTVRIADDADLHRPKLNMRAQRVRVFAMSGLRMGSIIWRGLPGAFGSSIAMQ